jgi:uncharacterized protein (DUF362 family)
MAAGGLALAIKPPRLRAVGSAFNVGVGRSANPYEAAARAIDACAEWPAAALFGRNVFIKPNLVLAQPASTGATTDPEVVRAVVDRALAAGAASVQIVENGSGGAYFSACGYDFFSSYDPQGRVSLLDLAAATNSLRRVPVGLAYHSLYYPDLLVQGNAFVISVAKMKTHVEAMATLSVKNSIGLLPPAPYADPGNNFRYPIHDRGVNQSTIDIFQLRPFHFSLVDGIWCMEGPGPLWGSPVRMDMAVAGANALAVDQVCLAAMSIPPERVQHLVYAAGLGLGPGSLSGINVLGDPITPRAFAQADIPPIVHRPWCTPLFFAPVLGQTATANYWVGESCLARVEIVRVSDTVPDVQVIRQLQGWTGVDAGRHAHIWDGRDDAGQIVPPGWYKVRVRATHGEAARDAFATNWIGVWNGATPLDATDGAPNPAWPDPA